MGDFDNITYIYRHFFVLSYGNDNYFNFISSLLTGRVHTITMTRVRQYTYILVPFHINSVFKIICGERSILYFFEKKILFFVV